MPWGEVSIVDLRREFVMLASLEGANVSELCARFGISRQTGYKWLGRSRSGSADFADHSRRPQRSPNRTPGAAEGAVLAVRDAHPAWGARKIACCLQRDGIAPPAVSTIHAILQRHGRIPQRRQTSHSYTRFERPAPNQLWQMDFKGRVQIEQGKWCHPLTVLDDHSRFLLCLQSCGNEQTQTVKPLLEKTFQIYGLPEAFYLDNGSPWGGGTPGQWTPLGVWLLKLGIEVIHSRPYHPQGRGKNERFHRTLAAEVFDLRALRDLNQVQKVFDAWRPIYNTQRPHQALDMAVPASRYEPSRRPMPNTLPEPEYGPDDLVRRVGTTKLYVSFKGRLWKVPQAFTGERVAIRPRGQDGQYGIFFGAIRIADIDLRT
jgi:transposase InsO family protein